MRWYILTAVIILILGATLLFVLFSQLQDALQQTQSPSVQNIPATNAQIEEQPERLEGTPCNAIIRGHNQVDYERANVIFVGFNVDKDDFVSFLPRYIGYNGTGFTTTIEERMKLQTEEGIEVFTDNKTYTFYGLLGTEPFNSSKNKFNFWYVDEIQNITIPERTTGRNFCNGYCVSDVEQQCGLKNIYTIYMCNANCTSYGSWSSNKAAISGIYLRGGKFNPYGIRLVLHEFGHSFGGLRDEYFETNGTNASGYPNCAPDLETAQEWWGDLVGQGEGNLTVGYFNGCSYNQSNIRPTTSSVMRHTHSYPFLDFGLVNERHLQEKLELFSGEYSDNITEKDPLPLRNVTKKRTRKVA